MTQMKKLYIVKKSPIHGRGVFAKTDIKKGDRIIEYLGEKITWKEANRRYQDIDGHSHTVFFSLDDKYVLDGAVNGNEAKFINHSCSPNCKATNFDGHIFIQAKKDIPVGKELFYDYKLEMDADITEEYLEKYKCYCGSKKCRGTQLDLKALTDKAKEKKKDKKKSSKKDKKKSSKKK